MTDDSREERHESFGKISVSRVSGSARLFQSPHEHQHFMRIAVHQSSLTRSLSTDHASAYGRPLVEIMMSEAQWAHFVASAGLGDGTPCTIDTMRKGDVHQCAPVPEREHYRDSFAREAASRGRRAVEGIVEASNELDALLSSSTPPSKARLRSIKQRLDAARRDAGPNLGFVVQRFEEHMHKQLNAAKTEVEVHALAALRNLGIEASRQRRIEGETHDNRSE